MARKIKKGFRRDLRDTFNRETIRFNNKDASPPSPTSGNIELYVKNKIPFRIDSDGSETQIESSVLNQTVATSSDAGTTGQMFFDSSFLYICIATDTWKRIALVAF